MALNAETRLGLAAWQESLGDLIPLLSGEDRSSSLDRLRESYVEMLSRHPVPAGVTVASVDLGGVPALRVTPDGITTRSTLLYFHGGAYIFGAAAGYAGLAARYALGLGATVYLPDYRLAPEHPFPTPIDDCVRAYEGVLALGVPADSISFAGDSAGGALTVSVMVLARDAGLPLPAAGLALSPWANLEHTGRSMSTRHGLDPLCTREALDIQARAFLGGALPGNPSASPVFADVHGLPPILVQVGENEVMLSGAMELAAHLAESRVRTSLEVWPGMFHVFQLFAAVLPEAREALESGTSFLCRALDSRA